METITDSQLALIDRFFSNELRKEELPEFEEQMQQTAFQEVVQLRYALHQGLKEEQQQDPLLQLLEREAATLADTETTVNDAPKQAKEIPLRPEPRLRIRRRRWLVGVVAASVLLLAISTWWGNRHYTDDAIIAQAHQPLLNNQQAGAAPAQSLLLEAKEAFFEGDYSTAAIVLTQIEPGAEQYGEAQLLLAYTKFETEEYEVAIPLFDQVLAQHLEQLPPALRNADKLRWTRLLAMLGADQTGIERFQQELDYFLNSNSDVYRQRAKDLEGALNSWWRRFAR